MTVTEVPAARIEHPAAWYGRDLQDDDRWIELLSDDEVDEIRQAVREVERRGQAILDITRESFSLPTLAGRMRDLARELDPGRGFWLLRGLPMDEFSDHEAAVAYWGLGLHMGTPVSQNARGHLLGHVTDEGKDIRDPSARGYQTRVQLPYHTDGCDVVGLLCLHPAKSGGLSSIVSSTTVYNEVLERRPDLAPLWFEPWYFDRRNEQREGEDPFYRTPLASWMAGLLSVRYVRGFMDSAQRHPEVPRRTEQEKQFLDLVDEVTREPGVALHMDFRPGDMQFICNYSIFHSRTEYEDWPEPERRRHLLRLWLALDEARPLPTDYGRTASAEAGGRGGIAPVPGLAEEGAGTLI